MNILMVEDEPKMAHFVQQAFIQQGFTMHVADSCSKATELLLRASFDLVIMDLGLPDGNGLSLLKEWRGRGVLQPVIILSARDALSDRVAGLNLGADDYLPKPFGMDELLARVRSLLRRSAGVKLTRLEHRGLCMDLLARKLSYKGRELELTQREFALLELFMQNPGRVLTRDTIAEQVWDASLDFATNLIDVYVRKLRMKINQPEGEEPLFRTIRGRGYQFS